MIRNHITHESQDEDAWVCLCGNTSFDSGFAPVNNDHVVVEPVIGEWDTRNYVCLECGRVIDMNALEIVDRVTI